MATAGSFTGTLWASGADVYQRILAHPFLAGLADGSLERASFRFYVVQDAHYLDGFARALALAAAKAPDTPGIRLFSEHAAEAIAVERQLHEGFFRDFGLTEADVAAIPAAPTTLAYVSYLLAVAYARPFHEVLAALLPCYWIYWEVGKALLAKGSPDPLYQRWIDTYGGEAYEAVVRAVLELAERVGAALTDEQRAAAGVHFHATARYEWMFWDMGWRREPWPV